MQMPYQSQALQAERRSSSDLPPSFPAMEVGLDGSMESLDGLDMGLFAAQQSNSMPDYSDLTQAASQLQVASAVHLPWAPSSPCCSALAVIGRRISVGSHQHLCICSSRLCALMTSSASFEFNLCPS